MQIKPPALSACVIVLPAHVWISCLGFYLHFIGLICQSSDQKECWSCWCPVHCSLMKKTASVTISCPWVLLQPRSFHQICFSSCSFSGGAPVRTKTMPAFRHNEMCVHCDSACLLQIKCVLEATPYTFTHCIVYLASDLNY